MRLRESAYKLEVWYDKPRTVFDETCALSGIADLRDASSAAMDLLSTLYDDPEMSYSDKQRAIRSIAIFDPNTNKDVKITAVELAKGEALRNL